MNIYDNSYEELKQNFDNLLNKDKSTYKNSNDEPTPIGCIEEMLNHIPQEAWTPDVKILDPCCGNGNFHLYALNKLKSLGLSDKEIVDNNLFFNDINLARLQNVQQLYGDGANITMMDFLRYPEDVKYDIIYANPPYAKFTKDNKRASKNHTLVRDFMSKSLRLLKDGGYMVYIIPNNWMSLADRNIVIKELTQYNFIHLDIHGAKKWFPKIGSSFTWLVMQKSKQAPTYQVECTYRGNLYRSIVSSSTRSFIPLLWTSEVQSIFSKTIEKENDKFLVETSSDLHKYTKRDMISADNDHVHKYRLIHTPKQTVYASRPHKYQAGYKCFISTTDKYSTFVDNCGMTQSIAFIKAESEAQAEKYSKILNHDLYRFLNNLCRWGNFNNIRILQRFPIPSDENNIYSSFGISEKEIEFIQQVLEKQ